MLEKLKWKFNGLSYPAVINTSRSITVPMVRTVDSEKANAEVYEYDKWPCDRRTLIDDLWLLALEHLPSMAGHLAYIKGHSKLVGRNLEPWQGPLAVAHWLNEQGVEGLFQEIVDLSISYQTSRKDLEQTDPAQIVIQALVDLVRPNTPDAPDAPSRSPNANIIIPVDAIVNRANLIAAERGLVSGDSFMNSVSVGKELSNLRIPDVPKSSGQGRKRAVTLAMVDNLARSYGLEGLELSEPAGKRCVVFTQGYRGKRGKWGKRGVIDVLEPCAAR